MPYEISFDINNRIIIVKAAGTATDKDHYSALDETVRLHKEKKCSRVLIDLHKMNTGKYSSMGCLVFGDLVAQRLQSVHLAHVLPTGSELLEDVYFITEVEANRKLRGRGFDTEEEARDWLIEKG